MEANRDYVQRLQDTVNEIIYKNPKVESVFVKENKVDTTYTIIYCSDFGLCGAYNQNILKKLKEESQKGNYVAVVGTKLYNLVKQEGYKLINDTPISSDNITFLQLKKLVQQGVSLFLEGKVSKVSIIYTKFVNTMKFEPMIDHLLPFQFQTKEVEHSLVETLFDPDPETILEHLIPMMIEDVAYSDWMESVVSEYGSRRVAMKTATDNAEELSKSLMLEYNKARQAAITQEITEIIGGSVAL